MNMRVLPGALALSAVMAGGVTAQPRTHYMTQCQGCHLPDGGGTAGKVPALAGQVDKFLQKPGGREFLIRVPGVAQSSLSDKQLAELLNWMVFEFGVRGRYPQPRFSAGEVRRYRANPIIDPRRQRAHILAGAYSNRSGNAARPVRPLMPK